jgi:hypothetical protein
MSLSISHSHVQQELALLRSLGKLRRLASLKMFAMRSLKQGISPIVMPVIEQSDEHPVPAQRRRSASRPLARNHARGGGSDNDRRRPLGEWIAADAAERGAGRR